MTENKRFERVYGDIEVVCIDHDSTGEDRFFDDSDYDKFVKSLNELYEENEQLKQFQDRVFNIIDKNIDELQKKYDFGQKNGMCPMHNILYSINILKDLKKELKE